MIGVAFALLNLALVVTHGEYTTLTAIGFPIAVIISGIEFSVYVNLLRKIADKK